MLSGDNGVLQRATDAKTLTERSTKLLVPRNGTNVEERINIENNLNLVYNIDYVI